MESKGLQFNEGRIIDASFVIAPRQRNTRDENEQIKQGAGDKLWNDNPHKKCHKDVDARWTKKRDETFTATSSILKLRNAIRSYFLMIPRRQKCMIPKALKDCWMKRRRQGLVFGRRLCRTRGDCKTA